MLRYSRRMPRKKTNGGEAAAPKAAKEPKAPRKPRKAKPAAGSIGLEATECADGDAPAAVTALASSVRDAGGAVLSTYREPLGGHWVVLAALPLDKVERTPYQRELSKAHADRLADVIPKVGRFLDPIVAVPDDGRFITPNGMHRMTAMRSLGAKSIIALVVPEKEVAFRILALNTEKAHNLRDKALEVVRMARALVEDPAAAGKSENEYQLEFEQPALLTMGLCYEKNGRFSGGAYMPVVARCEEFSPDSLEDVLPLREAHAEKLLALDELVTAAVGRLKEAGFTSGYLKPVVVARINPLRWIKAKPGQPVRGDFDKTLDKMMEGAAKFDPSKVKAADIAMAASMGAGEET
jgi:ParB family transcriptional regulator, chromosome partitioning protein